MATNSATPFEDPMDPTDDVDFVSEFDQLLEAGETIIAGFTVVPAAAATDLGFQINGSKPPVLETGNQNILYWVLVNGSNQQDAVFDDEGVQVEVILTITTTLTRIFQRSFLITVKQL